MSAQQYYSNVYYIHVHSCQVCYEAVCDMNTQCLVLQSICRSFCVYQDCCTSCFRVVSHLLWLQVIMDTLLWYRTSSRLEPTLSFRKRYDETIDVGAAHDVPCDVKVGIIVHTFHPMKNESQHVIDFGG